MSIGFARLASRGSSSRELRPASPSRERRQLEAGGLAGVGAEDPEAAGVRQHRDAPSRAAAAASRAAPPRRQLLERLGADHAGLVEERLDGRRPSRRARRCASRRPAAPAPVRPLFIARIGFLRATRRAIRPKRAGCRTTRGRAAIRSVSRSSSQYSSRSLEETSALLPIETNAERPRPRAGACSSSARPSAPLCDEKPIGPGGERARRERRVQRRPGDGDARGSSGRSRRAPCARTSASSCSWRRAPSLPISANPAEITQSARIPACERRLGRVEHASRRAGR